MLVATNLSDPATVAARAQLMVAGFSDVTLIQGTPLPAASAAA
jgi:hypothetical protein